jgi:hypothetical protein
MTFLMRTFTSNSFTMHRSTPNGNNFQHNRSRDSKEEATLATKELMTGLQLGSS